MNHTEKLCYDYTSCEPFQAAILELRPTGDGKTFALLDKSIFYPEGGGQPADRGSINGIPLLGVTEKGGEILHLVREASGLKPGPAELVLDSRRRRDLTQLHTGQHLLSGTIIRLTGARTVSMHMGDEACTIDVEAAGMDEDTLLAVEDAVADAIEENRKVIVHLCPPEDVSSFPLRKLPPKGEGVVRVVEIEGHDIIACCGTHLKSTAEIGLLRILGAEKYKGMTRISFLTGRRLLLDSRLLRQNAVTASRALSVPLGEIGRGVLALTERLAQTEKRLKAFEEAVTREKAEALLRKSEAQLKKDAAMEGGGTGCRDAAIIVESYADEGIDAVISIGKIAQKQCQAVMMLASVRDHKFAAFSPVEGFDLRPFLKDVLGAHGGRGGGSASFFQGSFDTKEAMDAFLEACCEGCFTGTQP